jgi:hypothetical protein
LPWSPELAITPRRLAEAFAILMTEGLDAIGFLREHFEEKLQWQIPQHTGLLGTRRFWEMTEIPRYADGDDDQKISTSVGPVLRAGMEDLARFMEILKLGQSLRIGMFGAKDPLPWTIDMGDQRQVNKIARQLAVAEAWALRCFPNRDPKEVIENFVRSIQKF